jgi:fluoride ion exporter CrcB/FEX
MLVIFGAFGTLARYALQGLIQYRTGTGPTGTLAVNPRVACWSHSQFVPNHFSLSRRLAVGITVGFSSLLTFRRSAGKRFTYLRR